MAVVTTCENTRTRPTNWKADKGKIKIKVETYINISTPEGNVIFFFTYTRYLRINQNLFAIIELLIRARLLRDWENLVSRCERSEYIFVRRLLLIPDICKNFETEGRALFESNML